jgi:HAD superfamily hydrolase (TIGR01509 family)
MITHAPFSPRAVIFDMDGLMLDTEKPVVDVWVQAAEIKGWKVDAAAAYRTIGINEASTKALLMHEYGPDFPYDAIRKELNRIMTEKIEKEGIAHRPGLLTLLDHLASCNIPMAVATSSNRKSTLWKLQKAGIQDRFTTLVCGDEISRGKPAPDIFLRAAELLGKKPEECLGFEDSPAGLQGLQAAGIRSVFIKDVVEPSPEILAKVWRRYTSLAEAVELLDLFDT